MGLNLKKGEIVFIDSAPLIYYWEENEKYFPQTSILFDEIYDSGVQMTASLVTYIEVITYPLKENNLKLAAKYRDYFTNSENFTLYPVNLLVAEKTTFYRATYNLKTPDAIQLATAEICGADYIITNDSEWNKIPNLNVIQVAQL